jgi:hypothetical protein
MVVCVYVTYAVMSGRRSSNRNSLHGIVRIINRKRNLKIFKWHTLDEDQLHKQKYLYYHVKYQVLASTWVIFNKFYIET